MPGIDVRTETRTGPAGATAPLSARYMVAGLAERGPVTKAQLIRSLAEYTAYFGDRVSYGTLYDDLKTFFEEGGAEAVVARVVGASATIGKLTLNDRAGSPLPTLEVAASSPGAWSSRIKVAVADGTKDDTFKLTITFDDAIVHIFDNLATPAEAVTAAAGSTWVTITDKGSATSLPNNQPAVAAATALSAGADDRASVTAADVAAGLGLIGPEFGCGAVATPGYTGTQVGDLLLAHAEAHHRLALLATGKTDDDTAAAAMAATLVNDDNGEHGVLLWPWINVPDGKVTRAISPEGYAAAARARAHKQTGPWRCPAGEIAQARYVLSPYVEVTRAVGDQLNDEAQVSVIRTIAGTTRLYGWRSLSLDTENYSLGIARDVLNYLAVEGAARLEPYVFQTIDGKGQLLNRVKSTLVGLVDPMRAAGGLYENVVNGETVDPGYSVDVSEAVNPVTLLQQNKIAAVLAVRVSPVGSLIELTIVKAGLTASV